jgi:hypothetical protein
VARRDKASALCRYAVIVAGNILSWTSPPPRSVCAAGPRSHVKAMANAWIDAAGKYRMESD